MKETELKLCKNCKHYRKDFFAHLFKRSDESDMCSNPVFMENLITGNFTRKNWKLCKVQRYYQHLCGKNGDHFELK